MLVSDVQTRVKEIFGDTNQAQITDAMILRWINDGRRELENIVEYVDETFTVTTIEDTDTYDIPVSNGRAFLREDIVLYNGTTTKRLTRTTRAHLTPYMVNRNSSVPTHYFISGYSITLNPPPHEVTTISIIGIGINVVDLVGGDDLSLTVPLEMQNLLVTYALYRAMQFDERWDASQVLQSEFNTKAVTARSDYASNIGTYPTIRDEYIW